VDFTERQPSRRQQAPETLKLYNSCSLTVQMSTRITSRIGGGIWRQRCSVQLLVEILRSHSYSCSMEQLMSSGHKSSRDSRDAATS
jgi:hypothetical protein